MQVARVTFPILVTPSESLAGQWIAHCLPLDVVTQGESIQHAFAMAGEAVWRVVVDDLEHGRDPLARASAPPEDWEPLHEALSSGRPLSTLQPERVKAAVSFIRISVPADALPESASRVDRPDREEHSSIEIDSSDDAYPAPDIELMPPPWQVAALRDLQSSQRPVG